MSKTTTMIASGAGAPLAEGHLQPRLSKLTMVAMSFAILNTWIAVAGTLGLVLPSGGSVSLLYGFVCCVICNFAVAASLGELAAIWPTAGGQYHFVYALCTEKWRNVISFLVGWINIAGWLTLVTTEGFFAAQFISAAAVLGSDGRYEPRQWVTYLIFMVILVFATVSNIWGNKILGRWNDAALYWSILSVVIISIVLLSMSHKTSAEYVFTDFTNETGWNNGVAWIMGFLQSALSLIGFDVVLHMTEEMPNPSQDAPRAMMYAIAVGGVTGLLFIVVILFCIVDPATVIGTDTGMPIVELIFQSTGSRVAGCITSAMLAICFINGTSACTTSVSRLIYAMARDKGIVYHKYFAHIDPQLNVPVRTIMISFVFNAAFGLLYLGPVVAFNAFIASCTIFLSVSYACPVLVLIIRGRGVLDQFQKPETPFQLGKTRGAVINMIAAVFIIFTSIFFCFPPGLPVSGNTMNYVVVVIGIFAMLFAAYWFTYGSVFQGPDFEIVTGQRMDSSHHSDTTTNLEISGEEKGGTERRIVS